MLQIFSICEPQEYEHKWCCVVNGNPKEGTGQIADTGKKTDHCGRISFGPDLKGATLIDAFAGTGAVGIEAISRGAAYVVFVEKNHQVAAVLKQNLKELGVSGKATVIEGDVAKLSLKEKFDFVIADPPYKGIKKIKIKDLDGLKSLAKQKFILSHPADFDPHMIDGELSSTII